MRDLYTAQENVRHLGDVNPVSHPGITPLCPRSDKVMNREWLRIEVTSRRASKSETKMMLSLAPG